ncbi:MAG: cytochrome c biogenesis CcdA family protein [Candidatus Methylomirabilales bacterium]
MATDQLSFFVALTAGLLSFLSPCTLPLFPSYLSFITGASIADLKAPVADRRMRLAVLLNAVGFILGFSVVFVALGTSFGLLGGFLIDYKWVIARAGGVLIILFGLMVTGWLRLPFLMQERHIALKGRAAGYLGAFVVGITFAAGWIPCVGPILGSIFTLAGTAGTASTGAALLAVYSLGLAIPFFLSALALNRFLVLFARYKRFLPAVSTASGLLLILVGALLVTNYFTILASYTLQFTPEWLFRRL